jgi:hypothetical protein
MVAEIMMDNMIKNRGREGGGRPTLSILQPSPIKVSLQLPFSSTARK